jgi:hypothetical protein
MPLSTRDSTEICIEIEQSCFTSRSQNRKSLAGRSEGQNVGKEACALTNGGTVELGLIATVQLDK